MNFFLSSNEKVAMKIDNKFTSRYSAPSTEHSDIPLAEVVKLVDTLASGASGGNPVEVQVLSSAPKYQTDASRSQSKSFA
jgi:hypothetical protein